MVPGPNRITGDNEEPSIISPFSKTTSSIRSPGQNKVRWWGLWIVSGVLVFVILSNATYFSLRYVNNPYRTFETFSVDKYLDDFQPLVGNKFKADFKVAADLGWKDNVGRLMVFTAPNDSRPILVLIPPKLSGIFFTKGQTYQVALEVEEGGLIYADSCDKE
jgi:hypothetical protein